MDYIFDEDIFEVGAEVDAFCTRCKTDTPHTVLTKYEEEIRSVQCTTCNSTHAYRPPRGDVEEDIPEPISVRRRQNLQKLPWEQALADLDESDALPYSPKERYSEGQVLDHPRFGVGYVSELLSDTKLEATFADGRRILVHNRGDLDIVIAPPRRGAPRPVAEALRKLKSAEEGKNGNDGNDGKKSKGTKGASVKPGTPAANPPAKPEARAKTGKAKAANVAAAADQGRAANKATANPKGKAAKSAAAKPAKAAAKPASAQSAPAKPAAEKAGKTASKAAAKSAAKPDKRPHKPEGAKPAAAAAAKPAKPARPAKPAKPAKKPADAAKKPAKSKAAGSKLDGAKDQHKPSSKRATAGRSPKQALRRPGGARAARA